MTCSRHFFASVGHGDVWMQESHYRRAKGKIEEKERSPAKCVSAELDLFSV